MLPSTLRSTALLIGFAIASTAACQAVLGIEDEDGVARVAQTQSDAGDVDAGEPVDPCVKAHPPPKPSPSVVGNAPDQPVLTFAARTFRVRPEDRPPLGYDLDNRCTGIEGSTTFEPPCTGVAQSDGPGGIDNGMLALVNGLPLIGDQVGQGLTESVSHGRLTILVQISRYNGTANDDDVNVALLTGAALASTGCDDAGAIDLDAGVLVDPLWDGCDGWAHGSKDQVTDGLALQPLRGAYVTDGKLVVVGSAADEVYFGIGGAVLTIHAPIFTGTLDLSGARPILRDSVLTGRTEATNLVGLLARIEMKNKPLCEDALPIAEKARAEGCKARDLYLPQSDEGRGVQCNAVSFTFGFDAEPVVIKDMEFTTPLACPDFDASCPD